MVDPAYATAQEHVETRIWNFHFLSVFFCQIAAREYFGSCNRWRNYRNPFFSFGNSFNETTSILEGRVVKVSHSTQTAILQLVDPACAAAQEHAETSIWNFHFSSVFSAKLRLGRISAVVTGGGIREILFFVWHFF